MIDFITGNKFKRWCNHSLDESGYVRHSEPNNGEVLKVFVKIDKIHQFFNSSPKVPFILITHNGDLPVDGSLLNYLDNPYLISWYGQNINTVHHKLKSIPIGIANEIWPHGNEIDLINIINEDNKKEKLVYVNFEITNFSRNDCLRELSKFGLGLEEKKPFKDYLRELSKSYFVISPEGNGIDCHKTWESLYLKTIPIVTRSTNIEKYNNLPILIIDDWSKFKLDSLSTDLYYDMIKDFNPETINIKNFLNG
jgi:hypothetical protein